MYENGHFLPRFRLIFSFHETLEGKTNKRIRENCTANHFVIESQSLVLFPSQSFDFALKSHTCFAIISGHVVTWSHIGNKEIARRFFVLIKAIALWPSTKKRTKRREPVGGQTGRRVLRKLVTLHITRNFCRSRPKRQKDMNVGSSLKHPLELDIQTIVFLSFFFTQWILIPVQKNAFVKQRKKLDPVIYW